MNGGRAVVEEGGKVLGYYRSGDEAEGNSDDAFIGGLGLEPLAGQYGVDESGNPVYGYNVIHPQVEGEYDKPYCVQNLKIVKGEAKSARVRIQNAAAKDAFESIIIADGAAAIFDVQDGYWDDEKQEWINAESKGVKLVKGLGNKTAKIYGNLSYWSQDGKMIYSSYLILKKIKELSNVSVDATFIPDAYGPDENWIWVDLGDLKLTRGSIDLGPNSTDCDFSAPEDIYGTVINNEMSKVTNCNLVTTLEKEDYSTSIYFINAINSKLTARYISSISPTSENSTFKGRSISFTNRYVSGNSATVKNCKFESAEKENYASISLPYQTPDRSSFEFIFNTCEYGKGFFFETSYEGSKPWVDKDGKKITKAYFWYELNEDGTFKTDDWGNMIQKRSASESDIPAANKANGKSDGSGYWDDDIQKWVNTNGYWIEESENFTEAAYYKDYKGIINLNNSKIDGKAFTKDTEFISYVGNGYDEKGEIATSTRYVIDGVSYKIVRDEDTKKYILIEAD